MPSSRPAAPHSPPDAAATPGRAPAVCTVLLAVHASRRDSLCRLLVAIAPACRFTVATSMIDATVQLARSPLDLLVLDLQLEPGQPLALVHLLARFAPAARVLAFADSVSSLPIQPYSVHGWPAAPDVLSSAIAASSSAAAQASLP